MRVVRRCMAKAASDRYESASAVAWEARGVLRELASPWLQTASEVTSSRRTDTTPPALRDSSPSWQARGFRFEPFASLDPSDPPYQGAPFDALRHDISEQLAVSGTTVIIGGAPSSGRSVLARSVLAAHGTRSTYIDLAHPSSRSGTLIQRIARAFGAVANPAAGGNPENEGLLEVLAPVDGDSAGEHVEPALAVGVVMRPRPRTGRHAELRHVDVGRTGGGLRELGSAEDPARRVVLGAGLDDLHCAFSSCWTGRS